MTLTLLTFAADFQPSEWEVSKQNELTEKSLGKGF